MEGILIDPNNIHAVDFIDTNSQAKKPQKNPAPVANAAEEPTEEFPTTFLTSGKDIFSIMNFVSGIHECINYGQVKSLNLTVFTCFLRLCHKINCEIITAIFIV